MSDEFTTKVYYDDDADEQHITDKTVAVLGYGSQGHAHALNLHDSGVEVIVGLRESSSSRSAAEAEGLRVERPKQAAAEADLVSVLVPDTVQPTVYEEIKDELEEGDTLQFAHGFNIHYGQIEPKAGVDVTMVAPKSPGHLVRRNYENDEGTPGLLAIYQDTTGDAQDVGLAYAKAIGCTRANPLPAHAERGDTVARAPRPPADGNRVVRISRASPEGQSNHELTEVSLIRAPCRSAPFAAIRSSRCRSTSIR